MTVQQKLVLPDGVALSGQTKTGYERVLTREALEFVARLHRAFEGRRRELMEQRAERQTRFDAGALPDFLPETREVREGQWTIGPIPADLLDRRVEITGPTDRKMIINALNSGARVFMTDFEDSNSPSWDNMVEGQLNLIDRWHGDLDFTDPQSGKQYRLNERTAVLLVRPRGWHLHEKHFTVAGAPVAGALFDFGIYFFHNAEASLQSGSGPYFYLPKMESHLEARLWNDVFNEAQKSIGLPRGTIKSTVLIETLPAAFEMHEILYELKDHITGLNCGRWDYIFSFIKTLKAHADYVLPDRSQVVMSKAFLAAYSDLLIQTCHRRGAFAMGGMAAQIPNRKDPQANEAAFERVRADKEREARIGHDGTWVAHPDLVPVATEVFDRFMPTRNQLHVKRDDVAAGRRELLEVPEGSKTENGFRENIRVGVQYVEAWLSGRGAVPLYNLMEDAATAEISRSQIWQWLHFGATLDGGQTVTREFFERCLREEMSKVEIEIGTDAYRRGRFDDAIGLFRTLSTSDELAPFLTIPAYELIG
jgi:malate synthase